ncbi:hypothetical protein F5883DRAFT_699395 [Diaporthe sp. PMI_573]|nr:hypothetical protein F5883DRAFT_699395 [Diaporthaceae sp. PMI_573]
MVFHRFQQLPVELRLHIWECALDEALLIDGLLTDRQKPVCHMTLPQASPESPDPDTKLATFEDVSLGHVCRESREVLRRCCGRFNKARDYNPSTDVIYMDNFNTFINVPGSLQLEIRHIALPADFCYNMLRIETPTLGPSNVFDQLALPRGPRLNCRLNSDADFFCFTSACLPKLESITIVLPPLEKSMPYYADHFPAVMRPSFLRIVPYSEVQRIRIRGRHTYTSWLRGSANTKRLLLGPFIKDFNEVWEYEADFELEQDDPRREITVQAGVLQYLEGPFEGRRRLSSIYKEAEEFEESQPADQGGAVS